MSAKHTPGQLIVRPNGGDWSASYEGNGSTAYMGIVNDQGTTIALAVAHSTDPWNEPEGPDEDARRLVACWNVCEGMSTESLELMPGQFFKPQYQRLLEVESQRDDLLAALRKCRDMVGHPDNVAFIDAAIANVTGGTPA